MANKKIDMRKVRELLRLKFEQGLSNRQAAKLAGIGKTAACEYISGFSKSALSFTEAMKLSDKDLLSSINIHRQRESPRYKELRNQFLHIKKELGKPHVTLQLLWEEYREKHENGYGYSQYCHHYQIWKKSQQVSMHIEHKAGDKMYVDFTGDKIPIVDHKTGEINKQEVFVAVLGYSQLPYLECVKSQNKADWIQVCENALRFFGGVPKAIVPDCLKSAVNKSDRYEPEINETFNDFARHYQTVILPARALHPKDKSLAENFVRIAYRRIFAPLRNETFHSVEEANQAMWNQLEKVSKKPFQGKEFSRWDLFHDVEKKELAPLPVQTYDLKEFARAKVIYNHHVFLKEDKHYYSVPFQLTGKKILMCYSSRIVEIYYDNKRVAIHKRNQTPYGYSTKDEHRPPNHQYLTKWNPQRFIGWAKSLSPEVEMAIKKVLDSKPHPEQAYKSCMGILNLTKKHEATDLIKACKKALHLNCISYKFIKNTLQNKTFNFLQEEEPRQIPIPYHENIRGEEFYN